MFKARLAFDPDGRKSKVTSLDDLKQRLGSGQGLVWIDIDRDNLAALGRLDEFVTVRPEWAEKLTSPDQRAVFSRAGHSLFLILYELVGSDRGDEIRHYPTGLLIGKNYVISVRDIERSTLDDVAERWASFEDKIDHPTPALLLYAIIDALVDNYFPPIDRMGDYLESLEDRVLTEERGDSRALQGEISRFRRQLFDLHRKLGPEREVLNELLRRDTPSVQEEVQELFHDVYDHVLRVLEAIDTYRDMTGTILEMQTTITSLRLDQGVRTLTVVSTILMVNSLIAAIYGMNFRHMPELEWLYGYPFALGLMVVGGVAAILIFRRRGWV